MIEIRIHGRGGQGVVTAAELIGAAAFFEGKFSQAFPSFGVERRGAPIEAYTRIAEEPILLHSQIYEPDCIIVEDPSLIGVIDVLSGAKKNTLIIVNTEKTIEELGLPLEKKIQTIPATKIALDILGKPIINTILLGAFAGIYKIIKPASLKKAIEEKFKGEMAEKNIKAMNEAYRLCNPKGL